MLDIKFSLEDIRNVNIIGSEFSDNITSLFGSGIAEIHCCIYKLITVHKPKIYGEIGSHAGRSAFFAARSSQPYRTNIVCFDYPNAGWGGQQNTEIYLEKSLKSQARDRHRIYYGNSHSSQIKNKIADNGPYDIFLIDGDHSAQGMLEDFETVWPHINNNGFIIIDDLIHHPPLNNMFNDIIGDYKIADSKYHKFSTTDIACATNNIVVRGVGIIQK